MPTEDFSRIPQCLIIAADEGDRRQLVTLIKPYGFELAIVSDAEQVLAVCSKSRPDVVVMPEILEGFDSFEFMQLLNRGGCGEASKVLVYSEQAEPGSIGRAIWGGASECFVKPFDASIIDLKLRQVGAVQARLLPSA